MIRLLPLLLLAACTPTVPEPSGDPVREDTAADESGDTGDTGTDDTGDTGTDDTGEAPVFGPVEIGGDRPVEVIVPRDYDGLEALPLVILLHGYTNNGEIVDAWLDVSGRVDADRFFLLLPDGTRDAAGQRHWNWFDPDGVDDEAYLVGLIDAMQDGWRVDPDRVFVMGHSNGGFMSYRLACRHADRIAGIVPIAGLATRDDAATCAPAAPVSVLHVHGTLDAIVPYTGGAFGPGAEDLATAWARRDGCRNGPREGGRLDLTASLPGDDTTVTRWRGCEGDSAVELWSIRGGSHTPLFQADFAGLALDWLLAR